MSPRHLRRLASLAMAGELSATPPGCFFPDRPRPRGLRKTEDNKKKKHVQKFLPRRKQPALSNKGQLYNKQTGRHIPALMWLSIIIPVLLGILVIVCILLTLVVLMQRPKNEGLGAAFGSGVTENIFGAQTATVLTKATVYLGCIFFALTLLLTVLTARQSVDRRVGVLENEVRKAAASATTKATASPGATGAPQASPGASASPASSTPAASTSPESSATAASSPTPSASAAPSPSEAAGSTPAPAASAKQPSPAASVSPPS
jgi:preprotein translocase subunit SecG